MENYFIEITKTTPSISFNASKGILDIKGRSIPEDSVSFFEDIHKIVRNYLLNSLPQNTINISLDYLNSSSTACLLAIMREYEKLNPKVSTQVNWFYEEDDEDILNLGLNFKELLNLDFKFPQIKEE